MTPSLPVSEQEQQRQQALFELTVLSVCAIVLALAVPSMLLNHTPAIVLWTTLLSVFTGIPSLWLNRRGHLLLAGLLFNGVFYGGLVLNTTLRNSAGLDLTSMLSYCYYAFIILITGLTLPLWLLWVTSAIIIFTTGLTLFLTPLAPSLLGQGVEPVPLRFAAVGILVTLDCFFAVIGWLVSRTARASLASAQHALQREQELVKLKDQFIVSANHELRTPIMALYGNIEFLMALGGRANAEQANKLMQRALNAGDIVLGLLNTIFEASVTEASLPCLSLHPVTLAPLIKATLETFDPREIGEPTLAVAEYTTRAITLECPPTLTVQADEKRLRQVFLNLLTNALKYSPSGSPISIHAALVQDAAHMVRITVRDYGLGVPPAEAPKLFQQFVRLERDVAGTVRGTGVGLYLCRTLVEAMGGRIGVASSGVPGEGSAFYFTLPLAATDEVTNVP